jgi:hypothetical protein
MNTPLSPFLDKVCQCVCDFICLVVCLLDSFWLKIQELFANKHLHVDGTKIESTGFQYEVPEMTVELLKEVSRGFTMI